MKLKYLLSFLLLFSCNHHPFLSDQVLSEWCILSILSPGIKIETKSLAYPQTLNIVVSSSKPRNTFLTQSYVMLAQNEECVPCEVDGLGNFIMQNDHFLKLRSGIYQWQLYAPAFPLTDNGNLILNNGIDFMATPVHDLELPTHISSYLIQSNPLERLCSKLNITFSFIQTAEINDANIDSVCLFGICDSAIFRPLDTDLNAVGMNGSFVIKRTKWKKQVDPTTINYHLSDQGICLLPFHERTVEVRLFMSGMTKQISPILIEFPTLKRGFQYQLDIHLHPQGMFVTVHAELSIKPWTIYEWDEDVGNQRVLIWQKEWQQYFWNEVL